MKKKYYLLPFFIFFALPYACVKKDLKLDVKQSVCKKFKIGRPSYKIIKDPCNGGKIASFEIKFIFDGDSDCLNSIQNSPIFYTEKNGVLNHSSFESTSISKDRFTISGTEITFLISVEFSDENEAKKLNHIILEFYTKNELEDESNKVQIRLNTSCSKVDPSTYVVNPNSTTLSSSDKFFTIQLWDNASEDGDIVSAYLNGNWIIENFSLLKDTTDFVFSTSILNFGANDLVIFALNEGTSGPNTVSIAINGKEVENFKPGLSTGEAVKINF